MICAQCLIYFVLLIDLIVKCLHLSFLAFSASWRCFRPRSAVQHQRFIRSDNIAGVIRALQSIPEGNVNWTPHFIKLLSRPRTLVCRDNLLIFASFYIWFANSWHFLSMAFIITKGTERVRKYGGFCALMMTSTLVVFCRRVSFLSPQVSLIISWSRNI